MSIIERSLDSIRASERVAAAALRASRARVAELEAEVEALRRRVAGLGAESEQQPYEDVSGIQSALDSWAGGSTMPRYVLEGAAMQDAEDVIAHPSAHPKRAAVARIVQSARLAERDVDVETVRRAIASASGGAPVPLRQPPPTPGVSPPDEEPAVADVAPYVLEDALPTTKLRKEQLKRLAAKYNVQTETADGKDLYRYNTTVGKYELVNVLQDAMLLANQTKKYADAVARGI